MPKRQTRAAPAPPPAAEARSDQAEVVEVTEDDAILEQRFAWLLNPIRDLVQNWDIDIAQELEKYLEELGHVIISVDPSEIRRKMNFAEAALLIQGTTGIYSKKVEYLYKLCYELLHTLARQRAARDHQPQDPSVDDHGHDRDASSLMRRAADFDDDFLPLDDIQECKDIDLNENVDEATNTAARAALMRPPIPLSLVPLEDFEKSQLPLISRSGQILGRRDDFWMNTGKIHPGTGTLLLDACNVALINAPAATDTFVPRMNDAPFGGLNVHTLSPTGGATGTPQISPTTPKAPDQRAQHAGQDAPIPMMETTIGAGDDDGFSDIGHNDTAGNFDPVMEAAVTVAVPPPALKDAQRAKRFGLLAAENQSRKRKTKKAVMDEIRDNPWQELDMYDVQETDGTSVRAKKAKRSRTYRVPKDGMAQSVESGTTIQVQLPDKPVSDYLNEFVYGKPRKLPKERWKKPSSQALADAYWSECKTRTKARTQRRKNQEGDGTILPPPSKKKRKSQIQREQEEREANLSRNLRLIFDDENGPPDDEGGGNDDDDDDVDDGPPESGEPPMEGMGDADIVIERFDDVPSPSTSHDVDEEVDPATMTYEDLVKMRLEQILKEAENNLIVGDITRRVQEWERKITPALQEDESRRRFDIHEYGGDLLEYFEDDDETERPSFDFKDFAETQEQWEVCRYFLSSLMLANTENVELATSGEEGTLECINTLNLTLLTRERHHEHLEEYAAPSARDK